MTSRVGLMAGTATTEAWDWEGKIKTLLEADLYRSVPQIFHAAGSKFLSHMPKKARQKYVGKAIGAFNRAIEEDKPFIPIPNFLSRFLDFVLGRMKNPPRIRRKARLRQVRRY